MQGRTVRLRGVTASAPLNRHTPLAEKGAQTTHAFLESW